MNFKETKEHYKRQAIIHTIKMEKEYAEEIRKSSSATEIFRDDTRFRSIIKNLENANKNPSSFKTLNGNQIEGLALLYNNNTISKNDKIAILNDGSYKNPGGRFLDGIFFTEEELCYQSYLYNVLKTHLSFYKINRLHINNCLYTNAALYTPNIKFWYKNKVIKTDVITCSSPNANAAEKYYQFYKCGNRSETTLLDRIEFIINICILKNINKLLVPNFGGGVHGYNPHKIVKYFIEIAKDKGIQQIYFTIPTNKYARDHIIFDYICEEEKKKEKELCF